MEHLKQLELAWLESVRRRETAYKRAQDTRQLADNAYRLLVEASKTEQLAASAYLEAYDNRPEASNGQSAG